MDNIIAQETGTEAVATAAMPESEEERRLVDEIVELWEVHVQAKGVARKTRQELKGIRERLSERLHQNKNNFWPALAETANGREGVPNSVGGLSDGSPA